MTDPLEGRPPRRDREQSTWPTGNYLSCVACLYDNHSGAHRLYGNVLTIVGGLLLCTYHVNVVAGDEQLAPQILGSAVQIAKRAKETRRDRDEKFFEDFRRVEAEDRPEETS